MELRIINGKMLVLLRNKSGKIKRVYSGPVAVKRWNDLFHHLNLTP
ncbi:MAG: hypothetical protein RQ756_01850 [Flavobacteriaceae bacterium]|nr:hypothetical protein [Flavobacteriaceae bacterium]